MKKLIFLTVLFAFVMVCSTESFSRTIPQTSQAESQQWGERKQMFTQHDGDRKVVKKAVKKGDTDDKDKKEPKKEVKKSVKKAAKKVKKDED